MRPRTSGVSAGITSRAAKFSTTWLDLAGAGDHRRHVGVLGAPRQRQLGERAAELVGDRAQLLDLGHGGRVGDLLGQPAVAGQGAAGVVGNAVAVLAGEQPRGQRAPRRGAVAELVEQVGVLDLDALPLEQVVLRLLGDRLVQVMPLGDLDRLADLRRRPLARSPVQRLAGATRCRSSPTPSPRSASPGSARWQYTTSTKSRPKRSSEPSIACIRYLRLSVFVMLRASWMPQNSFVVTTYDHRGQPSWRSASPMIASLPPPA